MRRYLLKAEDNEGKNLNLILEGSLPDPEPGPGEIRVRMKACSLNYRDLLMKTGKSASSAGGGVVPLSDGAGEVDAVGEGVTLWKPGDRVTGGFFRDWIDGDFEMRYHKAARGGSCDGVLSEFVTGPAESFIATPGHLTDAEAACLPCAGLTAWHGLMERGKLRPGQTVLALGTGGVSVFALQIASAAGAKVVITSSSDEKLARTRELGAWETVNYRENPEWDSKVFELTGKRGADHVIEVGGPGTLGRSMNAVAAGGHIALIGVLTGFDAPDATLFPLVARNVDLHGIYTGSLAMFARMNAFLAEHEIRPIIDRTFAFEETEAAFDYLESGKHFGKVVIEL